MNDITIDKTGWKKWRFDEFAQNISERVEPSQTDMDVYVGLEHIDPDTLHLSRHGHPSDVEGTKLRFYKGDIIFGRRRAYQRKTALATTDGICSAHAMVLRAKEDVVDPSFFPFLFHSKQFIDMAITISVGGLSPTINWKDISKQEFLLPPKSEQKRLAELLWAADEMIEKEKMELENITICKYIYFEREIYGANIKKLIECCIEPPQYGSPSASSPYIEEKSRYVRITDIDDFGNLLTEEIVSPLNFSDSFLLKENDFLIARTGNTVGKSYLHKEKNGLFTFAGYLIRFRTDESILLPDYLMAFTKTFLFEDFKRKTIKVGAQPNINAEQYSMMKIPILPISKQYNLIQQIEKYNAIYKSIVSQVLMSKQLKQDIINIIF